MSLREKNGKWEYRFQVDGEKIRKSTGLAATQEFYERALELEREAQLAYEDAAKQDAGGLGFEAAAENFLEWAEHVEYRQKKNTWLRIRTSFQSLRRFFAGYSVPEVDARAIEAFKTWRAQGGVRDVTIRHDLDNLSLFFRYGIRMGWARENFLRGDHKVNKPSDAESIRIHVLTPEDEARYFKVARFYNVDLHDAGRLIRLQGFRPDEVLSLRKEDVDLAGGRVMIRKGKTRSARRALKLHPEALEILRRRMGLPWPKMHRDEIPSAEENSGRDNRRRELFVSKFGKHNPWIFPSPWTGSHLVKLNNSHDVVCEDAGVQFVLYDLRHTFATRMVEAGVDLPTLAAILGHSGLRMVMRYVHPTEGHQAAAMEKFAQNEKKLARQGWISTGGRRRGGQERVRV